MSDENLDEPIYLVDEHDPYNPDHIIVLALNAEIYNEIFGLAMDRHTLPQEWVRQQIETVLARLRDGSRLIEIDENGWLT